VGKNLSRRSGPFCRLGASYIRRQTKRLEREARATARGQEEGIHDARVSSRRLREALKIFGDCFSAKRVRRWRRKCRRLGRRLGPARDAQVQKFWLEQALARTSNAPHRAAIGRLIRQVEKDFQAAMPHVLQAVEKLQADDLVEEMRQAARRLLKKDRKPASAAVRRRARREVLSRLADLLAAAVSLEDEADVPGHHQMRIRAKRLRYALEMFRPAYGRPLDAIIARAKKLQTLLGDLHDGDVWVGLLRGFLNPEPSGGRAGPSRANRAAIKALIAAQQQRNGELFSALVSYWRELDQRAVWPRLRKLLAK
jgi:CHAD domain-containing protein